MVLQLWIGQIFLARVQFCNAHSYVLGKCWYALLLTYVLLFHPSLSVWIGSSSNWWRAYFRIRRPGCLWNGHTGRKTLPVHCLCWYSTWEMSACCDRCWHRQRGRRCHVCVFWLLCVFLCGGLNIKSVYPLLFARLSLRIQCTWAYTRSETALRPTMISLMSSWKLWWTNMDRIRWSNLRTSGTTMPSAFSGSTGRNTVPSMTISKVHIQPLHTHVFVNCCADHFIVLFWTPNQRYCLHFFCPFSNTIYYNELY